MKKTIKITESQLEILSEANEYTINEPSKVLAPFIYKRIKDHTTSLGDNKVFPPDDEVSFEYAMFKTRLSDVVENIMSFNNIKQFDEDYLSDRLSKLLTLCMKIEEPIRPNLEKICTNAILRLFSIPQATVNYEVELVDKVEPEHEFRIKPEPATKRKFDFDSIEDFENLSDVIMKRRVINALIQGASYLYSTNEEYYANDINSIDKRLLPLYREIIAINDYLLFTKEEKITDKNPMQSGFVEVFLGSGKDKTNINAKAMIFPFLFHELIKGFMELFASHGLPEDNDKAAHVLKQADFLIAEPWDLRIGVKMWEIIIGGGYREPETLPYFFSTICELPVENFNKIMREIFAKTLKGKHILEHLIDNAYQDMEENNNYVPMLQIKDASEALIIDQKENE